MDREIALGLAAIIILGVGAQWLAARLRIPGILLLLPAGLLAGPVTGIVEPDEMFGEALFPTISMAVGVLLFEGGLGLRLRDLGPGIRTPVLRLITIGVAITWVLGAFAVELLFGELPGQISFLIGAVLVVSGPTVVGPILRLARPRDPSRSILSWEGITIDPIGATLGIVMLDVALAGDPGEFVRIIPTALVGIAFGLAAAALLIVALRRYAVPDDLEVAVALLFVIAAYIGAERVDTEAGLFATTVVGIALANQRWVPLRSLHLFGRTLGALIIGGLFIVLAARVDLEAVERVAVPTLALTAVLVFLVRPIVAWLATWRQGIDLSDRGFIAGLAPRGIVAAATSSLFAIKLQQAGSPVPELVPIVFGVIICTCLLYGLAARPLALALGVGRGERRTVVLVGNEPWVVQLATALHGAGVRVLLVATGDDELRDRTDLPFDVFTDGLSDLEEDPLIEDAAVAIAASQIEERNQLALSVLAETVGRRGLFHVPGEGETADPRSRIPFGARSREELAGEVAAGARFEISGSGSTPAGRALARIGPDGRVDCLPVGTDGEQTRWVCLVPVSQTAGASPVS
ncbi:MAG: cation:proton antiporter [Actinomycetota bacterium]